MAVHSPLTVCLVRGALFAAAAALLFVLPPAASAGGTSIAIVFHSQRVIWAEEVSLNPGHLSFVSETTGIRYGLPEELVMKVMEFDPLTAEAVSGSPALTERILLDPSFDPAAIQWGGFLPPNVLLLNVREAPAGEVLDE